MFFQLITIDFDQILAFGQGNPFEVMWRLFVLGGWIPLIFVCLWGFKKAWLNWRQSIFASKAKYVLLAIDVPKDNEQLPKAVENFFMHIHGAAVGVDFFEKWWKGKGQPTFSFEICSHGGYVQYYIRCETKFRDLVESALFSQYPDAEITEVDDYAAPLKGTAFPPPTPESMDLFGTEYKLKKADHFPIRTYPEFEEKLAGEFKDPLGPLLESLSKIRPEEQVWLQILASPAGGDWKDAGVKYIKGVAGIKEKPKASAISQIVDKPLAFLNDALVHGSVITPSETKKKDDSSMFKMMMLTPDTKSTLEAVATKIGKPGFSMKIRFIYLAPQNLKFVPRVFSQVKGAFNQFNSLHMNSIGAIVRVMTQDDYFWLRWSLNGKKSRLLSRYISRSGDGGGTSVMNVEELATIFHFPVMTVKAPLVKKTESRRAEPPSRLPVSDREFMVPKKEKASPAPDLDLSPAPEPSGAEPPSAAGPNLPPSLPFV